MRDNPPNLGNDIVLAHRNDLGRRGRGSGGVGDACGIVEIEIGGQRAGSVIELVLRIKGLSQIGEKRTEDRRDTHTLMSSPLYPKIISCSPKTG